MTETRLEELFQRYRDLGDVQALGQVFDATAPALLGLARHLNRGGEGAEDAVQATFLAAIQSAPRFVDARPLFPWLAGILARRVAKLQRTNRRRPQPERLPVREPRDPALEAGARELADVAERAIARLPEGDRSVLEAYLVEGLPPRAIAARRGGSAGAMRVRIHRALGRLRRAMPAGAAMGAAGLAGGPVLGELRARILAAGSGTKVAGLTGGGLALAWGLPAVLGLVLVGGLASRVLRPAEGRPALEGVARAVSSADRGARDGAGLVSIAGEGLAPVQRVDAASAAPLVAPPDSSPSVAASTALASARGSVELVCTLVGMDPGLPLERLFVRAESAGLSWTPLAVADALPGGAPDSMLFDLTEIFRTSNISTELETLQLEAEPEGYFRVQAKAKRVVVAGGGSGGSRVRFEAQLDLRARRIVIQGRILAPPGVQLEHPSAAFDEDPESSDSRIPVSFIPRQFRKRTECDAEGRFRLEFDAARAGRLALYASNAQPAARRIEFENGTTVDVGDVQLEAGLELAGIARWNGELLGRSGRVVCRRAHSNDEPNFDGLRPKDGGFVHDTLECELDAEGRFRFTGLADEEYELFVLPKYLEGKSFVGRVIAGGGELVRPPQRALVLDCPMEPLVIQVTASGEPVQGAKLWCSRPDGSELSGRSSVRFYFRQFQPWAMTGQEGFARLLHHATEPFQLEVEAGGCEAWSGVLGPGDLVPGAPLVVELVRTLEPGDVVLVLESGADRAEGLRLLWIGIDFASLRGHGLVQVENGRIVIPDLAAGRVQLQLQPRLAPSLPPARQSYAMRLSLDLPESRNVEEPIPVTLREGGRARVSIQGAEPGLPVVAEVVDVRGKEVSVDWFQEAAGGGTEQVDEVVTGRELILGRALEPGEYGLRVTHPEGESVEVAFRILAGETVPVVADL